MDAQHSFPRKPIARWTIGPVRPAGFDCLHRSIEAFRSLYDADLYVCYNRLKPDQLASLEVAGVCLVDQEAATKQSPIGVAWKLYPGRLDLARHELFIDNDLIIEQRIEAIDRFFEEDMTVLLEGETRNYGRYEKHVPPGYCINSGVFGVPPGFDIDAILNAVGHRWEHNCPNSSATWCEQGFVAAMLLGYKRHAIISKEEITNCELNYLPAKGMHFVSLNRSKFHPIYALYKSTKIKMFI